jgi:hypothetical protein
MLTIVSSVKKVELMLQVVSVLTVPMVDQKKNKTQPVMIVPHGAMVVLVLMITVKNVKVTECLLMSVYVHQDI